MKKKKRVRIISRIINFLSIICLAFFLYKLYVSNMIPTKYLVLISLVLVIPEIIYTLFCFNKKTKRWLLIFCDVVAVIFLVIELFGALKLGQALDFIDKNLKLDYKEDLYYVVVNDSSNITKLNQISKVYYYDESVDVDKLEKEINKKADVSLNKASDYSTLLNSVMNDTQYVIVLHSSNYESLIDMDEKYKDGLRIIDKISLKTIAKKTKTVNKDLTNTPFTIYLSGIDTRSGTMPNRSLSDVNMVVVVNPNTHKVLLVSTPRDYYVQLHGTTGLKDKLTHAGMIGGLEMSKATVEDIYGLNLDYYVRVNFNAVIKLVDAVGGINLYSDVNYRFSCWTDRSCVFKPGDNFVKGKCALAFARERHAYASGDRHRGENQQQVIKVLLDKLTSPGSILSNYSNILNSLEGTFETSFTQKDITSLINYQIDKMPSWAVESISVDGTSSSQPTNSYPHQSLSVMIPKEDTIVAAKQKISEIINEK